MNLDLRDVLIALNIIAMVGGAFYLVGMLRAEIRSHGERMVSLAVAIESLRVVIDGTRNELSKARERIANLEGGASKQ